MSDKAKPPPFDVLRPGAVRFTPSVDKLVSRWAKGCDECPHTDARAILEAVGRASFRSVVGKATGTYAVGFECPHCGAKEVAERGEAPTPALLLTPGRYRPSNSDPRSLECRACRKVTKPSQLVELLYPKKAERKAFLERHCAGARPREQRWVAARHDGAVAVAVDAEAAMDEVAPRTFPKEVELCLCFAIERPDVAELELPYVTVPLSERGEIKVLGWHGERPTANEESRHAKWLRRAQKERRREIERKTRLVAAELEREIPL